jgi:hypothetical protein
MLALGTVETASFYRKESNTEGMGNAEGTKKKENRTG